MTVKELKEFLEKYPDEMEVLLSVEADQVNIGIDPIYSGEYNGILYLIES